jgi:hypothetical protein
MLFVRHCKTPERFDDKSCAHPDVAELGAAAAVGHVQGRRFRARRYPARLPACTGVQPCSGAAAGGGVAGTRLVNGGT